MKYTQADVDALNATLGLTGRKTFIHPLILEGEWVYCRGRRIEPYRIIGAVLDAWSKAGQDFEVAHRWFMGESQWRVVSQYGPSSGNWHSDIPTAVIKANTAW